MAILFKNGHIGNYRPTQYINKYCQPMTGYESIGSWRSVVKTVLKNMHRVKMRAKTKFCRFRDHFQVIKVIITTPQPYKVNDKDNNNKHFL